ncbi:MAG: glycoside hydrolase family 3 C-terminal domain-containing protein [Bacteroidia bacterium]|nr:glycoside hydrolase family 3 C-terminal domain-containing protein [Bacteroidia bacterium]
MKNHMLTSCFLLMALQLLAQEQAFTNNHLPLEQRIDSLLVQLTIREKISLLGYQSPAIPRLNIPAYTWWNEGLHGVARAGQATVFPQAIGMAASFNPKLLEAVGDAVSTEARAKFNLAFKRLPGQGYMGLSLWSPTINLFRDPRWGRGQETYGEDPFLTGQMGKAYVNGLQGGMKNQLKVAACAKHLAVHSGPEKERHSFNAIVNEKDLHESYLYAFKKLVDADVESIMCAYNRINSTPCCTNEGLLKDIIRKDWKFKGHVLTDCWALEDIRSGHQLEKDATKIAAAALKAGVNLDCSTMLQGELEAALQKGYVTPKDIDLALRPLLTTRFKLGLFNRQDEIPYASFGEDSISNEYHKSLSRQMAVESMVLLKNNGILPLRVNNIHSLMVIGPTALNNEVLLANYHGISSNLVSFAEGIAAALPKGVRMETDQGCGETDTLHFGGIWAASNADITIACIGNTPVTEGEEGDAFLAQVGGDKTSLDLAPAQVAFITALKKGIGNKPLIAVVTGGGAINLQAIDTLCDAILLAWYPGEQGGNALADLLFGKESPSGRLPITYYQSLEDLPAYKDYAMETRTYRFRKQKEKYPFGFGLSYGNCEWLMNTLIQETKADTLRISFKLRNTSSITLKETVQVYWEKDIKETALIEFEKVTLKAGEQKEVILRIPKTELSRWNPKSHQWKRVQGLQKFRISKHAQDTQKVVQVKFN